MTSTGKYVVDIQGKLSVLRHPRTRKMIGTVRRTGLNRFHAINWRKEKQNFDNEPLARGWIGQCASGPGELNL